MTCPISNLYKLDTWLHVLITCRQQHIHSLHIKRHNQALWELRKLLISSKKSPFITILKETLSPIGYFFAHVKPKDATIIQNLGLIFFVLKDYCIKVNHQYTSIKILRHNSSNSGTATMDSHQKYLKLKQSDINY